MQPLIGVTAGEIINHAYPFTPPVLGQAHTYIDALVRAGGAPFIVPLVKDKKVLRRLYDQSAGLMLSGGNDLDPTLYDEKPSDKTVDFSKDRDLQEHSYLNGRLKITSQFWRFVVACSC